MASEGFFPRLSTWKEVFLALFYLTHSEKTEYKSLKVAIACLSRTGNALQSVDT